MWMLTREPIVILLWLTACAQTRVADAPREETIESPDSQLLQRVPPSPPTITSNEKTLPASADDDSAGNAWAHRKVAGECWTDSGAKAASCLTLGLMDLGFNGFTQDIEAADRAMSRSCDLGSGEACRLLGAELGHGPHLQINGARSAAIYEHGCALGNDSSCAESAIAMAKGLLGPSDPQKAISLLRAHCNQGGPESCGILGVWMLNGLFVKAPRVTEGKELLVRACRLGSVSSCKDVNSW